MTQETVARIKICRGGHERTARMFSQSLLVNRQTYFWTKKWQEGEKTNEGIKAEVCEPAKQPTRKQD